MPHERDLNAFRANLSFDVTLVLHRCEPQVETGGKREREKQRHTHRHTSRQEQMYSHRQRQGQRRRISVNLGKGVAHNFYLRCDCRE